jgi:hypothetical protein
MSVDQSTLVPPPSQYSNLDVASRRYLLTLQVMKPLIEVDTTGGNVTQALPAPGMNQSTGQSAQGQELIYRKISPDVNTVTITGSPDGNQVLTTNSGTGSVARFQSNGTVWRVVNSSSGAGPAPPGFNFADAEIPAGLVNGINDTFNLLNAPNPPTSLQLVRNGAILLAGYTLAGNIITFAVAPMSGDELAAWYRF